jgi:glycosyltransferase involved in cell wall biosynthesis
VTASIVAVFPAPPHPRAKNTAARYYAALLRGLDAEGARVRALAIDDGSAGDALAWSRDLDHVELSCFTPRSPQRSVVARARRLLRPMVDAPPPALRRQLAVELRRGYDVLHVEEAHLGDISARASRGILSVLHSERRDLHTELRAATIRQRVNLRAERVVLRAQRRIRTISDELAEDVRISGSRATLTVIPLALDIGEYEFVLDRAPTIGLIGSMFWPPTRRAAVRLLTRIWPCVLEIHNDARLLVAGWRASTLADEVAIPKGVEILSDIADPGTFFDRIGILAFPLDAGSGMKIKVLESMAVGAAVVTTPAGVEGLRSDGEAPWWVAESDDDFVREIAAAIGDDTGRAERVRRARALVEEQVSPSVVAPALLRYFEDVAGGRA